MDAAARRRLDALLAALADGDRRAFDPVYSLCAPIVTRYAQRTLSAADADDVAQAALLRLFARASEYDPRRPALPWILGIVANEVRTHRRRVGRRREEALTLDGEARERSPEDAVAERELIEAAESLLEGLSPTDREAIASAIGACARPLVAPATFRKRLSRALARLRAAWTEAHHDV